ncbi:unnamed protein product [marine sediment metagenome]|uniref:Uncharacterized protein n=1 Tax=marine sediment metagenome TaxID=412755 RepID=X0TXU5_9ZZZZ
MTKPLPYKILTKRRWEGYDPYYKKKHYIGSFEIRCSQPSRNSIWYDCADIYISNHTIYIQYRYHCYTTTLKDFLISYNHSKKSLIKTRDGIIMELLGDNGEFEYFISKKP